MEILIFVLRTAFQVLIYAFIFVVIIYVVKDLRGTGQVVEVRRGQKIYQGQCYLKVEHAPGDSGLAGSVLPLGAETRMGRNPKSEIVLSEKVISNNHARIYFDQGQYWLEDLGSTNGTFLNGLPLSEPAVLANGDRIKIGDYIFRLVRWKNEVESDHRVRPGAT
ncbi:FHA domain-containing protein [Desulfotruncus alcoholivorax]|uniref:FHA domain-containing protein n=1 Tax=Desulfotruncus alcoholivorax TaxID=265477 RepID=UPI00068565BF|nr:FHA domain-containing protein [Desulfotruncus alcoholivorax]